MYEFDTPEYWAQEQLEQYERDMYEKQCREQAEQEYYEFCHRCHDVAHDWLLGNISEEEAINILSNMGAGGLLEWAEGVLKGI